VHRTYAFADHTTQLSLCQGKCISELYEIPFITFWVTVASNSSPYATGLLSCLSVTLVYCDQTVGWIKMPLGKEVVLGPGDNVLGRDPAPPRKEAQDPPLRPMSIVAKWLPISATTEIVEESRGLTKRLNDENNMHFITLLLCRCNNSHFMMRISNDDVLFCSTYFIATNGQYVCTSQVDISKQGCRTI